MTPSFFQILNLKRAADFRLAHNATDVPANADCALDENDVLFQDCNCSPGFLSNNNADSPSCDDVDECNGNVCPAFSDCYNTEGSFNCQCQDGYESDPTDPTACSDVDECKDENICHDNSSCINLTGDFMCACNDGFEDGLINNQTACVSVDDCTPDSCGANEDCVDGHKSTSCVCSEHYNNATGSCEETNYCLTADTCDENSTCAPVLGDIECNCNEFYHKNSDGDCVDKNECLSDSTHNCGNDNDECVNDIGTGYHCECSKGWESFNNTCIDIDECQGENSCADTIEVCVDTDGSYQCDCASGYARPNGNATLACDNVNECDDALICDDKANSSCEDNVGSYYCKCNSG